MTIHVKFFASLREKIGVAEMEIDAADTVEQAWNIATQHAEKPVNLLVAINLNYAQLTDHIKAGDEVAFFPPVTGG